MKKERGGGGGKGIYSKAIDDFMEQTTRANTKI